MLIMDTKDQKQGKGNKARTRGIFCISQSDASLCYSNKFPEPSDFHLKIYFADNKVHCKNNGSLGNPLQMMIQRANMLLSCDPSI